MTLALTTTFTNSDNKTIMRVIVMIVTTMLILSGLSWATHPVVCWQKFCESCFGLTFWDRLNSGLPGYGIVSWSSSQDMAANLPDAFLAHPWSSGCRGQILSAATMGFRISNDGNCAEHASIAVLGVNVASSSLLCTALHLDSKIGLSFLWCGKVLHGWFSFVLF